MCIKSLQQTYYRTPPVNKDLVPEGKHSRPTHVTSTHNFNLARSKNVGLLNLTTWLMSVR